MDKTVPGVNCVENQDTESPIDDLTEAGFKVSRIPDQFLADLVHVKISKAGNQGIGSSLSATIALAKAYHEYHERTVLKTLKLSSSSGLAAHYDEQLARESSQDELIERDVFLTSWFSQTTPYWLDDAQLSNHSRRAGDLIGRLRSKGIVFRVGVVGSCSGYQVSVGIVEGKDFEKPFGMILATAAGKDFNQTCHKIAMDLSRTLSILILDSSKRLCIKRSEVKKPADHLFYYLDPDSCSDFEWYLKSNSNVPVFAPFDISTKTIDSTDPSPLWTPSVSQASSTECQSYFAGLPGSRLNAARFIANNLKPVLVDSIHPLG